MSNITDIFLRTLAQSLTCGGCGEVTTVESKYTCEVCGRILCGKCGATCTYHKEVKDDTNSIG